jgi:DNA-binding MarR family transcriptional regulator
VNRLNPHHTDAGAALTAVVLRIFGLNGALLSVGEQLAREVGLTSATWQVLGAVELAERPLTVPQIARRMGLARQSVHATARVLVNAGLLRMVANADHRRSALVASTSDGQKTYRALEVRQAAWVNALASEMSEAKLRDTKVVLDLIAERLEQLPPATTEASEISHDSTLD